MSDEPRCENCLYWRAYGAQQGECRRRAPLPAATLRQAHGGATDAYAVWPQTQAGGWCGEYQPRPQRGEG